MAAAAPVALAEDSVRLAIQKWLALKAKKYDGLGRVVEGAPPGSESLLRNEFEKAGSTPESVFAIARVQAARISLAHRDPVHYARLKIFASPNSLTLLVLPFISMIADYLNESDESKNKATAKEVLGDLVTFVDSFDPAEGIIAQCIGRRCHKLLDFYLSSLESDAKKADMERNGANYLNLAYWGGDQKFWCVFVAHGASVKAYRFPDGTTVLGVADVSYPGGRYLDPEFYIQIVADYLKEYGYILSRKDITEPLGVDTTIIKNSVVRAILDHAVKKGHLDLVKEALNRIKINHEYFLTSGSIWARENWCNTQREFFRNLCQHVIANYNESTSEILSSLLDSCFAMRDASGCSIFDNIYWDVFNSAVAAPTMKPLFFFLAKYMHQTESQVRMFVRALELADLDAVKKLLQKYPDLSLTKLYPLSEESTRLVPPIVFVIGARADANKILAVLNYYGDLGLDLNFCVNQYDEVGSLGGAKKIGKPGRTPLHWAVEVTQHDEVIRWLLSHGADINVVDEDGQTVLTWARRRKPELVPVLQGLLEKVVDKRAGCAMDPSSPVLLGAAIAGCGVPRAAAASEGQEADEDPELAQRGDGSVGAASVPAGSVAIAGVAAPVRPAPAERRPLRLASLFSTTFLPPAPEDVLVVSDAPPGARAVSPFADAVAGDDRAARLMRIVAGIVKFHRDPDALRLIANYVAGLCLSVSSAAPEAPSSGP